MTLKTTLTWVPASRRTGFWCGECTALQHATEIVEAIEHARAYPTHAVAMKVEVVTVLTARVAP